MTRVALKILLLVVVFVGGGEVAVRTVLNPLFDGTNRLEDFYLNADREAANGPVDVVFVGSSRVAASIAPEVVGGYLSDSLGTRVKVISAGKGYSTLMLHYFGLQRLYRDHPDNMQGALVLIEAPGGVPVYLEWSDKWVTDTWPTLMGPLLTRDNVGPFLRESPNTFRAKIYALAADPLRVVRYARYLQPTLESKFNNRFDSAVAPEADADLAGEGGIRTDSAGVALVREEVLAGTDHKAARDSWNWDNSVLADIVKLVRSHGGEVAFFEMPVSSYWTAGYPPGRRELEATSFHEWAGRNQLEYESFPTFQTTDDDFPDLMHMRKSMRNNYSRSVAERLISSGLLPH